MESDKQPTVSVITPYYMAKNTIRQTISSVQKQSFIDWEMIIVDDNSNDDIDSFLRDILHQDSRIKLIRNINQKGAAGARNTGITHASGRYIAFLDSDDIWSPEKLDSQINFMKITNCSFSYGNYFSFSDVDEDGNPLKTGLFKAPNQLTFKELCKTCSIGCLTVMLDRKSLSDIKLPYSDKEDYALWLNLTKIGITAENYGGTHAYYRVRSNSLSSNKFREILRQYRVVRNVAGLSRVKSFVALLHYVYFGLKKHKNYRSSNV